MIKETNGTVNTTPTQQKIGVPTSEGFTFILVQDILYCKADSSYTYIFKTNGEKIVVTLNLGKFEDKLNVLNFFRIHTKYLINLNYVEKFHKGDGSHVIMSDGSSLTVSRRRKNDFLQKMNIL